MTTDSLDDALRDHYHRQSPSPAVLDRLRDATAAADRGRHRARRGLLAVAALLALVIAWLGIDPGRPPLVERVATEVSMNHRRDLGLDFTTASYDQLNRAMDQLDFALTPPDSAHAEQLALVGGRYCSLQGQIAAQLRLEGPSGRRATLYATRLDPSLAALGEQTVGADDVQVTVWSADGIFFALARENPGGD